MLLEGGSKMLAFLQLHSPFSILAGLKEHDLSTAFIMHS